MPDASATQAAAVEISTGLVAAAEKCRWDTMNFAKFTFKLYDFASWLASIRAQLLTRKAAFLLQSPRQPGNDHLQQMCLFALKAALPVAKRPTFSTYTTFTEAFQALEAHYDTTLRDASIFKQSELTNLSTSASETITAYLDRAAALWGSLVGSPEAIDEACAGEHALCGLPSPHASFLALAASSNVSSFAAASQLALRHSTARIADSPEIHYFHGSWSR